MSEAQGSAPSAGMQAAENVTRGQAPQDPGKQSPEQTGTQSGGVSDDATKAAAREAIRKLKLKHDDGREEEVPEDEVLKIYKERKGHQSAANKILQEGKAAKKQAETFVQMMKDKGKLFEAIQKLGHDPRKLAEEYLASQLEDEMMDPREKDLRDTKRRLEAYENLEKKQKEAEAKKRDDELKAKYSKEYSDKFVDALKKTNLPPTKPMVAEMAKYIHRAAKLNFEMTPEEAAILVKEDLQKALSNLYGEADAETLVRLLGDQGLQKIRAYDVGKIKDPMAHMKTPDPTDQRTRQREPAKRMDRREWIKFNRK